MTDKEFWQAVFIAVSVSSNVTQTIIAARWADEALKLYQDRWRDTSPSPGRTDFKGPQ